MKYDIERWAAEMKLRLHRRALREWFGGQARAEEKLRIAGLRARSDHQAVLKYWGWAREARKAFALELLDRRKYLR